MTINAPLTKDLIDREIRPLFSRVLKAHEGTVYLANHSLGRPMDRTFEHVAYGAGLWAEQLDEAWSEEHWTGELLKFRSLIAQLLDLSDPRAVVPKMSAGQGLRAILNSFLDRPLNIVSTRGEFDSADFILKTYHEQGVANVHWVEHRIGEVPTIDTNDVVEAIRPETDLVVISAVMFGTGQRVANLEEIIEVAHRNGALVVIDVYHALGVYPFSMSELGADFCIGGCYKYLRGGAGSCFLAIAPWILDSGRRTLDTGWFAKKDTFKYIRLETAEPWAGGDGWLESTSSILTAYQATPGLEFTLQLGVQNIREYVLGLVNELRESFRNSCLPVVTPVDPEEWGAFALVPSSDAASLSERLREHGVVTDARGGFVRFGPDILTTSEEISRAATVLKAAL